MKTQLKIPPRGQTLTEFAIILPVLLVFVFLIIDLSRAAYFYSVVFNSAREGARYAAARPCDGGTVSAAKQLAGGLNIEVGVSYDTPYCSDRSNKVEVSVSYRFEPATPILWDLTRQDHIDLHSRATMQIEQ